MVNVCGFVNDLEKKGENRVTIKHIAVAAQSLKLWRTENNETALWNKYISHTDRNRKQYTFLLALLQKK